MLDTMLDIALVFHSSRNDNLGVGALTVAQVDLLRRLGARLGAPLRIAILDGPAGEGARAPYVSGADVEIREVRPLRRPQDLLAAMRAADIAIDIGAGDSFADIYGRRRLATLFAAKLAAHAARTPLVVAPQTMGPFTRPLTRRLARASLHRSAIVATRDALSTRHLADLGIRRGVIEASDLALRLPYAAPPPRAPGARPRAGLNVSGLLMAGGYTGRNEFGLKADYPALMRALVRRLLQHPERPEVHLVPHVIPSRRGGPEDDLQACLDLAAELPGAGLTVAPAFAGPSEAKSYIAGMDFFAGARMHACIAAFSSGVPVVPLAYSRKFAGLFGSMGYARTADCAAEGAAEVEAKVMEGFERRAALAAEVAAALPRGLERLGAYEDALEALMRDVLEGKRRRAR